MPTASLVLFGGLTFSPEAGVGFLGDTWTWDGKTGNGTQLADTLIKLHGTMDSADQVVKHLDAGMTPAMKQLPAGCGLTESVKAFARTLATVKPKLITAAVEEFLNLPGQPEGWP